MPRARCHWAMLVQTRDALRDALPEAHALVARHQGEFFAGGVAPDALRLFAGRDKLATHFYDDQRPETWNRVVQAIRHAQPCIAEPAALTEPALAWLFGYLTHVLTDIAYWRHIVTRLPPFPEHAGAHYGAWVLADQAPIPHGARRLNVERIRFDHAPPWVDEQAVRQMLERVVGAILVPDERWQVELAYARSRPDLQGRTDAEVLAELLPQWQRHIEIAASLLPTGIWPAFFADAVEGAVSAIGEYLCG